MDTLEPVKGKYLLAGSAESFPASARLWTDGSLELKVAKETPGQLNFLAGDFSFGPSIPGLAVDILFKDGAVFSPDNTKYRWRDSRTQKQGVLEFLESNLLVVVLALVLTPLAFWWIVSEGIPKVVDHAVVLVPQSVPEQMGKEALYILDKIVFEESSLPQEKRDSVVALWQSALRQLQLPVEKFELHFRSSEQMGANALALPNGAVIVTDDIVELLADKPNAMLSVLLHEIGHVEHRHSLKLVSQSLTTSIVFAVFLGDIEGVGEMILGGGSSLLQNAFSREMESEADDYSFAKLEQMGISPAVFAEALQALIDSEEDNLHSDAEDEGEPGSELAEESGEENEHSDADEFNKELLEYMSSHPLSTERINKARQRGERFEQNNQKDNKNNQ